jgi:hypothetical protein
VTIPLYNFKDGPEDANNFIKFVEPCPKVQWAGILSRDRGFLVNTKSSKEQQENFKVTVFNPDFGTSSFQSKTSGRLENIYLSYRKLGEMTWQPALIELTDGAVELDFAAKYASEDDYGYTTLDWFHGGFESKYEIMVETRCDPLGGPADIDSSRASTLTGVIDLTKPEMYGEPLPLRNDILLGEEVSVVFTEPLDCGRPLSFDLVVDVLDTNYVFDKDNLHVICEGRKIGFQIDQGQLLEPDLIMGKTFTVTIGAIGEESVSAVKDVNGNEMDFNINFSRTFADLDLSKSSTSFTFTLEDMDCTDTTVTNLSDDIKNSIALTLEMSDTSRLELADLNCHETTNQVIALLNILPPANGRRKLKKGLPRPADRDLSTQLFYMLRSEVQDATGRRLDASARGFSVGSMKIIPSDADLLKYQTHPDKQERERKLYRIGSLQNSDMDGAGDFMIQEIVDGQRNMKEEMESLHKSDVDKLDALRAEIEALRQLDLAQIEAISRQEGAGIEAIRRLEEDKTKELKGMFMQFGIIMAVCCVVAGAVLVHLTRYKHGAPH